MRGRVTGWLVSAIALAAGQARADDTSALQSLLDENVITTASTTAERAATAPAVSTTISAEELETYGIRTLAEAINFLGLGVVTQNPLRTPDIGSRGVLLTNDDGKHVLLLLNGHAVNDPLYGAARFDQGAGIPFDLIDHIEVIVGPGSVLYGSNAMMGVINVITKDATNYRGGHVSGEFEPARSWRTGAGTGFLFDLFGAPSELTLGVEYYERFGPDLDFGEQRFPRASVGLIPGLTFRKGGAADGVWGGTVHNAYFVQAPSAMLRLRSGDFEVNVFASAYRRGVPYSTETTDVFFDSTESYERDRSLRFDIKHNTSLGQLVRLSSRLHGDAFGYQRLTDTTVVGCIQLTSVGCAYHDVGQARWLGIEEQLSLDWLGNKSLVTLLGIDFQERWVETKQDLLTGEGAALGATAGRLDTQGSLVSPYLQQTYSPTAWLDLNVGARVDIDSRFSPVISPRGAIALQPGRGTILKGIYSEAFRAPTFTETDLASYRVAPSEDLRPETVRSVEGSIEQRFSTQRLLFGVFRTWWHDMVLSEPISPAERNRLQNEGLLPRLVPFGIVQSHNVASVDNFGWNGGWNGSLAQRLRYGVNATAAYTRRKLGSTSLPLAVAPSLFGNAHVAYATGGYAPTPALAVSYLGRRLDDRALVPGTSVARAPALAEFRFTLTGKLPGIDGLRYRASAAYTTAAESAYVAGPNGDAALIGFAAPPLERAPIDQFSAFFGLRYDFLTGSETGDSP